MPENIEAKIDSRYTLSNRYQFTGRLVMQTAFHIGGGKATLSGSDSPVILTPIGEAFIPGSSFKGVLRSTVEKIVPVLPEDAKLFTCALIELNAEERGQMQAANQPICSSMRQDEITLERRNSGTQAVMKRAREGLCDTCRLFGSPFTAAHVMINDLYLLNPEWNVIQQRDGVAIDRDSEKARDRLKYDFEVVPASTAFGLNIVLENATDRDIQLLCIGLSEFMNGFGFIGGKRSRGLGACLLEDLKVASLVLDRHGISSQEKSQLLQHYFLQHKLPKEEEGKAFVEGRIKEMFEPTKKQA